MLLGWTTDQWSIAAGHISGFPKTFAGACKLQGEYLLRYGSPPSEELVFEGGREKDRQWATEMMLDSFRRLP